MQDDECIGIDPAATPRPRDQHGRMLTQDSAIAGSMFGCASLRDG
jgi:hypothetical protein